MPNYPYKVRVLAGLDSVRRPGRSTPISLSSLESAVRTLCTENQIALPSSWKKRLQITLDALVSEGWISKKDNNSYLPSAQLRTIIADEKLRLNVSQDTHDLKTFSAVARRLKSVAAEEVEEEEVANNAPSRRRRRSARLTSVSLNQAGNDQNEIRSSPSVGSVIQVQSSNNIQPSRSRKPRHSDPGPMVVITPVAASKRRASAVNGTQRKRASNANRRHTLAVVPTRQPPSYPAGAPREMQFIPLKQALSARARRALRRSALSEEMNSIEAEDRAKGKKNREELIRLRSQLAASTAQLERLEQLLAEARHAPSIEPSPAPLSPIREEREDHDEEMADAGFGMDMDFGVDYEDNTPEPEVRAPRDLATPFRSPSPVGRMEGARVGETPISTRDQRINELQAEIDQLRDSIRIQAEEARRREEQDEEFHDAEEQILQEENHRLSETNASLSNKLHELQSPRLKTVAFDESTIVEETTIVDTESLAEDYDGNVVEEYDDSASLVSDHVPYRSSGVDSGIAAMDIDASDSRIAALETDNEQLQAALDSLNEKLRDLEGELEETTADSTDRVEQFRKDNDSLRRQSDRLQLRITELEELEGERLARVGEIDVQTEPVVDEEKESLKQQVYEMQELIEELEGMVATITEEKRTVDITIAECHARIKGLQRAIEVESREKDEALKLIASLRNMIIELENRTRDLSREKQDMLEEVDTWNLELENLRADNERLNAETAQLRNELGSKDDIIQDLSEQIRALNSRATEFETELDLALEEIRSLRSQGIEKDSAIGVLRQKISDLDSEHSNKEQVLEKQKTEIEQLDLKVLDLEDLRKSLEFANAAFESDIETLQRKNETLESANESLDDALSDARAEIINLENQLEAMEIAADNAEDAKEEFENTIAQLRTQVSMLEKAVEASNDERQSLERDAERLQNIIDVKEKDLAISGEEKGDLRNEILSAQAQIEAFKEAALSASQEKDQLETQVSDMLAQIEGFRRAKVAADKEREETQRSIDDLNDKVDGLLEDVEAAKAEKELLKRDVENYQTRIAQLEELLDISQRDKATLEESIVHLQSKVSSLESALASSDANNVAFQEEIEQLNEQITVMKRSAEAADDEKRIIAQKIQPYLDGQQSLDMAIDEVLTELVMAKNRAQENERLRVQLENKIRLLARNDQSMTAEEAVERLTDRFRDVRSRVEKLYLQRREEGDSSFQGHRLEDFAWTGSNENALEVLSGLVEDMDQKLVSAKQGAQLLKQELDAEKMQGIQLKNHLGDVVSVFEEHSTALGPQDIPSFVRQQVRELEEQLETAEARLSELIDAIKEKNATIDKMQLDIDGAAERETDLQDRLEDALNSRSNVSRELEKASAEIDELYLIADDKDKEIEELETQIERNQEAEKQLSTKIQEQAIAYESAAATLEERRIAEVKEVEDKLADALATKSHLEMRLREAAIHTEATVKDLEKLVSDSRAEVDALNTRLDEVKAAGERAVDDLQDRLADAEVSRDEFAEQLQEARKKRDEDVKAIETKLSITRDEAANRISALEAAISERDVRTKQLSSELNDSVNDIKKMEIQISTIESDTSRQREELEATISALRVELATARENAAKEQQQLQAIILSRNSQVQDLQLRVTDLEKFLNEAESNEERLEEELKESEARYQLLDETSTIERDALTSHKNALRVQLEETKDAKVAMESELRSNISALQELVNQKKAIIEQLEIKNTTLERNNGDLLADILTLKTEKSELEEDLAEERRQALVAMQDLQTETTKFLARFGDVKNLYVKQSKMRESKKRGHREVEQSEEIEEQGLAPPSPSSTLRRLSALEVIRTEPGKVSTKRRKYDSGIGVDAEEDEGFEGSVMMSV